MVRFRPVLLALWMVIAFLLPGCEALKKVGVTPSEPELLNYESVLKSWTRHAEIYQHLDTHLLAEATFQSVAFRKAYAHEYSRVYHYTEKETEKLLTDQLQAARFSLDFILAAYVPEEKFNDFDQPRSVWKLYLVKHEPNMEQKDEGKQVGPTDVRRFFLKNYVTDRFYPNVSHWARAYIIRFPFRDPDTGKQFITDETTSVDLFITGPNGTAKMTWEKPEEGWQLKED